MAEPSVKYGGELIRENEWLRARLAEAESKLAEAQEVIGAIQSGDVDAVVVSGPEGDQVFTLRGAEYAYRALVEAMNEGAATLGADGTVLYCNQRLADLLKAPMEQIIGSHVTKLIAAESMHDFEALLARAQSGEACKAELDIQSGESNRIPGYVSLSQMRSAEPPALCMVMTDLTERKKRDELIAAGKLSTSILESAAEAIAVCDESGTIILTNQALEALCGGNPLYQNFNVALPLEVNDEAPDGGEPFSIFDVLGGLTLRAQEVCLRRPNGTSVSLLLTAAPIQDSADVVGCVLTMTDITTRKHAQEAVKRQADLLRLSYDAIIVWQFGTGFESIESWNLGAEQLYGYTESEAVGHNPHELLKTIHGVPFTEIEAKLRKDGNWEGELRHFTKDGRELVVSARHQLIVGSDGVERILETNRDITERKRSESVLRASEARLRLAHIAANAGTWEWDLRTNTNFWSDEAWKVYGLVPGSCEPSYEAWLQLIHPDDLARVEQAVRDAVREGKELIVEWRLRDADGAERWLMSRGQPVRDTDGVVASYIGIVLDISERKRSEEALLRSEKLASLGRMASTISHEINNPLETIGHALYLALTDSGTSETARSYLELAVQELDRVTHITRQTLAFHRDSNAPKLIDLRESVDSIVKLFASRLKSREITIEQRYPEVERINAFSSEIQQVISNLLSNSMDAVPRRGRIHLRLSRSLGKNGDRRVRFTIADNGSGIPLDRQKKIFEPFFTTKEVVGTGLGLWVTKQIVDKHKATIRVRSKLGRGTVFSITFPTGEANMQAL